MHRRTYCDSLKVMNLSGIVTAVCTITVLYKIAGFKVSLPHMTVEATLSQP